MRTPRATHRAGKALGCRDGGGGGVGVVEAQGVAGHVGAGQSPGAGAVGKAGGAGGAGHGAQRDAGLIASGAEVADGLGGLGRLVEAHGAQRALVVAAGHVAGLGLDGGRKRARGVAAGLAQRALGGAGLGRKHVGVAGLARVVGGDGGSVRGGCSGDGHAGGAVEERLGTSGAGRDAGLQLAGVGGTAGLHDHLVQVDHSRHIGVGQVEVGHGLDGGLVTGRDAGAVVVHRAGAAGAVGAHGAGHALGVVAARLEGAGRAAGRGGWVGGTHQRRQGRSRNTLRARRATCRAVLGTPTLPRRAGHPYAAHQGVQAMLPKVPLATEMRPVGQVSQASLPSKLEKVPAPQTEQAAPAPAP